MNWANLQCEVEGLSPQEAHMHIALVALVVISVAIAITASALNAIAISQKETRPDKPTAKFYSSAPDYGYCKSGAKVKSLKECKENGGTQ